MSSKRVFILVVVLSVNLLVACGSRQTSVALIPVETEQIPTTTPTPTPIPTSTPIPTAIPDVLGAMPTVFEPSDVSAVSGQIVFQITGADVLKAIGEIAAADQRQFLVFYGNIYNYGDTEITIHDVDIKLTIGQSVNTDVVLPSVDLMNAFRSANNLDISFPDRNLPFYPDFKVPAHKAQATVLVYDVPADATLFKIQFFSETPNLSIFVWFETQPVTVHKIAQDGDFSIEFVFDEVEDHISEVLDTEIVEVDNCFGTADISREFNFSRESTVRIITDHIQGVRLRSLIELPIIGDILRLEILDRFQREEMQRLVESRTEILSARPGTKPQWQLTWYLETISVGAVMNIGDRHYDFTVKVTDRLRSELKSLAAEPCES